MRRRENCRFSLLLEILKIVKNLLDFITRIPRQIYLKINFHLFLLVIVTLNSIELILKGMGLGLELKGWCGSNLGWSNSYLNRVGLLLGRKRITQLDREYGLRSSERLSSHWFLYTIGNNIFSIPSCFRCGLLVFKVGHQISKVSLTHTGFRLVLSWR